MNLATWTRSISELTVEMKKMLKQEKKKTLGVIICGSSAPGG